jgi:hypothetical protein
LAQCSGQFTFDRRAEFIGCLLSAARTNFDRFTTGTFPPICCDNTEAHQGFTSLIYGQAIVSNVYLFQPSNSNHTVRFADKDIPKKPSDTVVQPLKSFKELSSEDKMKIANLIKEMAR